MSKKNFENYKQIMKRFNYDCSPETLLEITETVEGLANVIKKFEIRTKREKDKNKQKKRYGADPNSWPGGAGSRF